MIEYLDLCMSYVLRNRIVGEDNISVPEPTEDLVESSKMETLRLADMKVTVLSSSNYYSWKSRLIQILALHDLECAIQRDLKDEEDANLRKLNKWARCVITANLCDDDVLHVSGLESAFEIWLKLERKYQSVTRGESFKQLRVIKSLTFSRLTCVEDLKKFRECTCKWNQLGEAKFSQRMQCELLVSSLPVDIFENLIANYASVKEKELNFEKLYEEVLARAESISESEKNSALVTKKTGMWKPRCFKCGEIGHIRKFCKNVAKISKVDDNLNKNLEYYVANCYQDTRRGDEWILDSGANVHVCCDRVMFKNLQPYKTTITSASGDVVEVTGIGGVDVFEDVLFAPLMTCSLLSVSRLTLKGYSVVFTERKAYVRHKGRLMFTAQKKNSGLYCVLLNRPKVALFSWHQRLGHCGKGKLHRMGIHEEIKQCIVCDENKMRRTNFSDVPASTDEVLGRIFSDVCGPFPTGVNDWRYFITFIDEKSRLCRTAVMKSRTEVLTEFESFVYWAENQTGKKVKSFVSDNAKEYKSEVFTEFCRKRGIELPGTDAYCPQQNGICERKNQSICAMARCLINEKDLPTRLWPYAVLHATTLLNRIPSDGIGGRIPYEVFYNKGVDVGRFRVFGSLVMALRNSVENKFSKKAIPAVLVGVSEKFYLLYNPQTDSSFTSRNVRIYEDQSFDFGKVGVNSRGWPEHLIDHDYTPMVFASTREEYGIPSCYEEVLESPEVTDWEQAILEESESLCEHDVFEEVSVDGQKCVDTKWVFTEKVDEFGMVVRRKARLVAKGFLQRPGVDFEETFAPVCDKSSLRVILALAASRGYVVHHVDIKTAFLNGVLDEEIFVNPPEPLRKEGKIWKLKKSLYGLKQSPRNWNRFLDGVLVSGGFKSSKVEPCLYWNEKAILLVYVDDILLACKDESVADDIKIMLSKHVKVHDLGCVRRFLNINVRYVDGKFFIDQEDYIRELAKRYGLERCRKSTKPLPGGTGELAKVEMDPKCTKPIRSLLGALLYIANVSRPDVMASVSFLSRFLEKPSDALWNHIIQVLRYLVWTSDRSLVLGRRSGPLLELFVDSDFASDVSSRKSQSGYVLKMFGSAVLWASKKQPTVSLSSAEAEYVALASGVSTSLGIVNMLRELGLVVKLPLPVYEDNQPCIDMAKTGTRVKHIDVKYHFIQDLVKTGVVKLLYISTQDQHADGLTKTNPKANFDVLCDQLGLTKSLVQHSTVQGKC